jgi:hypothetical protein
VLNVCFKTNQVADNSIDMPDANVLIQISSMYGCARERFECEDHAYRPAPGFFGGWVLLFLLVFWYIMKLFFFFQSLLHGCMAGRAVKRRSGLAAFSARRKGSPSQGLGSTTRTSTRW